MCDTVAKKMLATVKTCKLYPRATSTFEKSAARGDCEGMWAYFVHCIKDRPDVGRGMQRSGEKPLEAVTLEMERLYQEHRMATVRQ